jgi:hypothetical protein
VAYAAVASAAGVCILAGPTEAEGKIMYTRKHVQLYNNGKPYPLDFNRDAIPDFYLFISGYTCGSYCGFALLAVCDRSLKTTNSSHRYYCGKSAAGRNEAMEEVHGGYATAAVRGVRIGKGAPFYSSYRQKMGGASYFGKTNANWYGPWVNDGKGVTNRYLGLRFTIDGQLHYGWARLTVTTQGGRQGRFTATLTGYAYETIPNKSIIAGETKGSDVITVQPTTLGRLAFGRK